MMHEVKLVVKCFAENVMSLSTANSKIANK